MCAQWWSYLIVFWLNESSVHSHLSFYEKPYLDIILILRMHEVSRCNWGLMCKFIYFFRPRLTAKNPRNTLHHTTHQPWLTQNAFQEKMLCFQKKTKKTFLYTKTPHERVCHASCANFNVLWYSNWISSQLTVVTTRGNVDKIRSRIQDIWNKWV